MIPGYYNFICNKKNKNFSNELEKIEMEEIEPMIIFSKFLVNLEKQKQKI